MKQFAQIVYRRLRATSAFSPVRLFANGEIGAWYDPSDMTTLFQDSAGITPVTAVEQPVGLMLDKSQGLVLGSELVTNGTFDSGTGWTLGTGWSISGGVATGNTATTSLYSTNSIGATANKWYIVTYTVTAYTSGTVRSNIGSNVNGGFKSAIGTYTEYLYPTAGDGRIYFAVSNFVGSIDNISVRELPGNHASQSTSASRPVLSARVNLLRYTEEFDNAYWGKASPVRVTITANSITAPDGTLTADTITETTTNSTHRVQTNGDGTNGFIASVIAPHRLSVSAKKGTRDWLWMTMTDQAGSSNVIAYFDLANGAVGTVANAGSGSGAAATITSQGDGWYRCTLTGTSSSTSGNVFGFIGLATGDNANSYTGDVTKYAYIWGADLRVANAGVNLPVYQRVGAATYGVTNPSVVIGNPDYDTTGFPLYLKFDGTDDSMATGTINPDSVDKAQVFAGVRKLSDAAQAFLVEFSVSSSGNAGSFCIFAPQASADYGWRSRGSLNTPPAQTASSYAAPITNILTGLGDISGDLATLRINGTQVAQSTADQGTGNYLSYPLYIGSRAGTSLRFNGYLYSLVVRFSATNLPDATIAQTETWVNGKTYAYGPPVPSTANNLIWATGNNLIWDTGNNITWGNS